MKRKKTIIVTLSFLFLHFCFFTAQPLSAQVNCANEIKSAVCEDEEKGDVYKEYNKYRDVIENHETSDPIASGFHRLGWWIIQGLATVSNMLNGANHFIYEQIENFVQSDFVQDLSNKINLVSFALLPIIFISISFFGMVGKQARLKESLLQVLIAVLFINGVGYIYQTGFELIPAMDSIFRNDEVEHEKSFADELLLDSIIDIEYYKNQIDDGADTSGRKNNMTKQELDYLDVNEPAPYEKSRWFGMDKETYFNRAIVGWDNENDAPFLRAYDNQGLWGFGKTFIYKYKINYWEVLISLLLLLVGEIFIETKRGELLLELGASKIFSNFVAVLSIRNKQQLITFLQKIFELFSGIMLTTFSLMYYVKFSGYIATININFFAKLPLMLANVYFLFKMSQVVNLIFGVNIGTNNFLRKYLGAKMMSAGANAIKNKAQASFTNYRTNKVFEKNAQQEAMMKQQGKAFGQDVAHDREAFLHEEGTTIDDYKDTPHFQSDYTYSGKSAEEIAQSMQSSDTKKGYKKNLAVAEKHLDSFNEAGREAYERKFPTYKQRQKEYQANLERLEEKEYFERSYPIKYNRELERNEFSDYDKEIANAIDWSDVEDV